MRQGTRTTANAGGPGACVRCCTPSTTSTLTQCRCLDGPPGEDFKGVSVATIQCLQALHARLQRQVQFCLAHLIRD